MEGSCKLVQRGNAIARVGMGREEIVHALTREGIDDVHMGHGGVALGGDIDLPSSQGGDLFQRRSQRQRIAGNFGADPVGLIFARAADGHLHQHGCHRREKHHQQGADPAQRVVAVIAAAKEQAELGQGRNGAGKGRRNGHGQGIAVADMGQLVGDHGGDLAGIEMTQQAGRDGHGSILGIAAGGKGIGLVGLDQVNRGRRDPRLARENVDHVIELRHPGALDRHGILHAQHQLVGVPVADDIGDQGKSQGDHHAAGAADEIAHGHEQRRERGEQNKGAKRIEHQEPLGSRSCSIMLGQVRLRTSA